MKWWDVAAVGGVARAALLGVVGALLEAQLLPQGAGAVALVGVVPGVEAGRGVVPVLYVPAALEYEGLEAGLAQLLGGPAPGDPRADHDGVVGAGGGGFGRRVGWGP